MAKNKANSGGEVTIIKSLQALEDYKKVMSKNINITNPDGSEMFFTVHAITPERFAQINADYQQTKPEMPLANRDGQGKERKEPGYDTKLKKYHKDVEVWGKKLDCWSILAGWVEPEEIEIEGKTDVEKVDELFKKMPAFGVMSILTHAIMAVSNLSSKDVDFM